MNKAEAIAAMLGGKKVRGINWEPEEFIFYKGSRFFGRMHFPVDINYTNCDQWEIYQEPKPKVKMWQFVIRNGNNRPCLTPEFYSSARDIALNGHTTKVVQRADWTEIEVEG
jgi:hypothetical protein